MINILPSRGVLPNDTQASATFVPAPRHATIRSIAKRTHGVVSLACIVWLTLMSSLGAVEFTARENTVTGTTSDGSPTVLINVKGEETLPGCEREYLTAVTYPTNPPPPGTKGNFTQDVRYFPGRNTITVTSATAKEVRTTTFTIAAPNLRVFMEWDGDDLDYDLYVNNVNWTNPQTPEGKLERDAFAGSKQGPGKEEINFRSAKPGSYAIYVNYYSDHRNKESSPTKITVYLGKDIIFSETKTITEFEGLGGNLAGTGKSVWNVGTVIIHGEKAGGYRVVDENWLEKPTGIRDIFMGSNNKPMVTNGTLMGIFPKTDYQITGLAGPKGTGIVVIGTGQSAQFYANGTVNSKGLVQNCTILGKFHSSDATVAKIDDLGVVSGLKGGKATITVDGAGSTIDVYVVGYGLVTDVDRDGTLDEDKDRSPGDVAVRFLDKRGTVLLTNTDFDSTVTAGYQRDCDDEVIGNQADLDKMARIKIRKLGIAATAIPDGIEVVMSLSAPAGEVANPIPFENRVRIFASAAVGAQGILGPNHPSVRYTKNPSSGERNISELAGDGWLELGGEGIDHGSQVVLSYDVRYSGKSLIDERKVRLLSSPFILIAANAAPMKIWSTGTDAALERAIVESGVAHGKITPETDSDRFFAQDAIEIGWTALKPKGVKSYAVFVPPRRYGRTAGVEQNRVKARDFCRENKYGFYFVPGQNFDTGGDSYCGNIEAIPIVDVSHPYGRALIGANLDAWVKDFIERQGVQTPAVAIDVSPFSVKHVDEVVTVTGGAGGYVVLLASPAAGAAALNSAKAIGLPLPYYDDQQHVVDPVLIANNQRAFITAVANVRSVLVSALVPMANIQEIPVFYGPPIPEQGVGYLGHGSPYEDTSNPSNMLILGNKAIVPDPFFITVRGKIQGKNGFVYYDGEDANHNNVLDQGEDENLNGELDFHDILKERIRSVLIGQCGITCRFLDATRLHELGGEIHCASNCTRVLP